MSSKSFFHFGNKLSATIALMLVTVLALAACQPAAVPVTGSTETPVVPAATMAPAETTAATQAPASMEATINISTDPKLGKFLVGGNGMTLYVFSKDGPNLSNCSGKCLVNWPALLTQGSPKLGDGVDASLIGSATLADGSKIVTYNKMPLYYFYKDQKPGDVTGEGVGSVWYVMAPSGQKVDDDAVMQTPAPAAAASTEATINVATDPKLGKILVAGNGMTLYIYTKDGPNQSTCIDKCLAAWPALLTQGNPKLGDGVDASLIGSATLADGSKIVTYNKMPLYYWVKDKNPGDVTGQGVGKVWYVIGPDGKVIGNDAVMETPAPAATSMAAATSAEATINVATDPKLGKILVAGNGMTLYIYTKDGPNQSTCIDKCLAAWPALLTQGSPKLGDGVDASLIGSATLADGSKIVTYNKMPLYYWVKDKNPGDVTGQGVGKVWFVIGPDGKVIGM